MLQHAGLHPSITFAIESSDPDLSLQISPPCCRAPVSASGSSPNSKQDLGFDLWRRSTSSVSDSTSTSSGVIDRRKEGDGATTKLCLAFDSTNVPEAESCRPDLESSDGQKSSLLSAFDNRALSNPSIKAASHAEHTQVLSLSEREHGIYETLRLSDFIRSNGASISGKTVVGLSGGVQEISRNREAEIRRFLQFVGGGYAQKQTEFDSQRLRSNNYGATESSLSARTWPISSSSSVHDRHNNLSSRLMPKIPNKRSMRAPRMRWTSTLHAHFVQAVELLGGHESMQPAHCLKILL